MEQLVGLIQIMINFAGCEYTVNGGDVFGILLILILFITSLSTFFIALRIPKAKAISISVEVKEVVQESWKDRLRKGLAKSSTGIWGQIGNLISSEKLSKDQIEEIEELLYSADLGPGTVSELVEKLEEESSKNDMTLVDLKGLLYNFLSNKMKDVQENQNLENFTFDPTKKGQTKVVMIVGVNGAGKTTTIGKLATKLRLEGAKVVVGACDTFRAAAVDQLQIWCDRAQVEMVRAKEGANPSGVAYETLQRALNDKADYCLLDTAGRLHTKGHLMDELTKSKRVLQKLMQDAPQHVLLVIDAVTGQNALRQAIEFNKALELTGLIFTKCDSSSKAGSAIPIVNNLKVPILYIGVGESVEDLDIFNLNDYLHALLDMD